MVRLQLVLLQVVVHLSVHLHVLQRAFCPLVRSYLVLGQSELLLGVEAVCLQFGASSISDVRCSPTLLQSLHLVIQILLLVHVLTSLINDCLSDAACSALLFVVVAQSRINATLLTRAHRLPTVFVSV